MSVEPFKATIFCLIVIKNAKHFPGLQFSLPLRQILQIQILKSVYIGKVFIRVDCALIYVFFVSICFKIEVICSCGIYISSLDTVFTLALAYLRFSIKHWGEFVSEKSYVPEIAMLVRHVKSVQKI